MTRFAFAGAGLALILVACIAADRPGSATAPGESVAELRKARIDTAADALRLATQRLQAGVGNHEEISTWQRRLTDARLEAATDKDQRIAILTEGVAAMKDAERIVQNSFNAGLQSATQVDVVGAKYLRLEAELRLAKARTE